MPVGTASKQSTMPAWTAEGGRGYVALFPKTHSASDPAYGPSLEAPVQERACQSWEGIQAK